METEEKEDKEKLEIGRKLKSIKEQGCKTKDIEEKRRRGIEEEKEVKKNNNNGRIKSRSGTRAQN